LSLDVGVAGWCDDSVSAEVVLRCTRIEFLTYDRRGVKGCSGTVISYQF